MFGLLRNSKINKIKKVLSKNQLLGDLKTFGMIHKNIDSQYGIKDMASFMFIHKYASLVLC